MGRKKVVDGRQFRSSSRASPCRERWAHLSEHGGLCRGEASDESLQQVRQDRADRGAGLADEVDDEVADEQAGRLVLRRLQELGDLSQYELEAGLARCRTPRRRWGRGQCTVAHVGRGREDRDAPGEELVDVLTDDRRDDVEARLDDVAVLGPGEHLEDDLGDAIKGALR